MTDSAAYYDYLDLNDIYDRGVALGNYLKDKMADMWGKEALWVQKNPDPAFATFLTSFNPFADKDVRINTAPCEPPSGKLSIL